VVWLFLELLKALLGIVFLFSLFVSLGLDSKAAEHAKEQADAATIYLHL
jgi:hypothetical protein